MIQNRLGHSPDTLFEFSQTSKTVLLLFTLALAMRVMFGVGVIMRGTPPLFDENGYFESARAFNDVLDTSLSGSQPTSEQLQGFLRNGVRPPIPALFYGSILFLSSAEEYRTQVVILRLANIVISSLTTLVIFHLTKEMVNDKAAIISSVAYALD